MINEAGINIIKFYEGWSATPYICPAGYLTIGWGHMILKNEKFTSITKEEGTQILINDLRTAENAVARLIKVPITLNQYSALTSFTFNLGGGVLQNSTLRSKLNRKEYDDAGAQLLRFVFAGGKKLPGLIKRRQDEYNLYMRKN